MTDAFLASRLSMARTLRGLTSAALSRSADVTPEWLSKVERERTTPSDELISRLAAALDVPREFFFRPSAALPPVEAFYFRASSKLAQKDEAAARALAAIAIELSEWMDAAYQLPESDVPTIQELIGAEIDPGPEVAAESLRNYWGLGTAPISNMLALLEVKGVRVFSLSGSYKEIDAFSFRHNGIPIILLNPSKSAERLRFDLAHELAHLLLHDGSLYEPSGKIRERQANDFASALLMPRAGILGSLRADVTLDSFPRLRAVWKVSSMAIAVRLHTLGITSDWSYRLMCQELSRRGFRRGEPGSTLAPESSSLWAQVLSDLREQGLGLPYIAGIVGLRTSDVRNLLFGLATVAVHGGAKQSTRGSATLHLIEN